ncbi:hypothetical protein BU16DRAFT_583891 [Lophium mytilinum]|uniref:REJ domain-containing protein n=1 Tax=Lophium mytilinum TaxID=390894 RepID=A0A6A6QM63_9PEZI|nr:hypothetical protein BU16DRAFT_583891 [Lophium mytilinum]
MTPTQLLASFGLGAAIASASTLAPRGNARHGLLEIESLSCTIPATSFPSPIIAIHPSVQVFSVADSTGYAIATAVTLQTIVARDSNRHGPYETEVLSFSTTITTTTSSTVFVASSSTLMSTTRTTATASSSQSHSIPFNGWSYMPPK